MIKFFRKIRQKLLSENRFSKYLIYAIGEIALVMIGILLALQVNNWNESRKNQREQYFILNKLQDDIYSDIKTINSRNKYLLNDINNYITCLEFLGRQKDISEKEFFKKFASILGVISFDQNSTTFNNLVSSGKLELITNKSLSNTIVKYYTADYKAWDTGLRDYTRNVIGPYLLQFDHIPQLSDSDLEYQSEYTDSVKFYIGNISSFEIKSKTIEDYRKDLFIINALRHKLYSYQGQLGAYSYLLDQMEQLAQQIEKEKEVLNFNKGI